MPGSGVACTDSFPGPQNLLRRREQPELRRLQGLPESGVTEDVEPVVPARLVAPLGLPSPGESEKVISLHAAGNAVLDARFQQQETRAALLEGLVVRELRHVVDAAIGETVVKGDRLAVELEEEERQVIARGGRVGQIGIEPISPGILRNRRSLLPFPAAP